MPSAADIHGINKGNKGNSLEFIAHVILEKQSANVPKGTKKKLQESCLIHVFCLRKSARSAGDFGVSIEYSCVDILPQIAQRNDACARLVL